MSLNFYLKSLLKYRLFFRKVFDELLNQASNLKVITNLNLNRVLFFILLVLMSTFYFLKGGERWNGPPLGQDGGDFRSRLMKKLNVRDLPSLVKFALEHGLTAPG
jgi:hypothetical protein